MIRTLLIIAAAGLVACMLSVGGFLAVGGIDAVRNGDFEFGPGDHSHVRRGHHSDQGPPVRRSLAWAGTDSLQVDLPAEVSFTQAASASVTVSGPRALVDQVVLEGGRLRLADSGSWTHRGLDQDDLRVTISAPGVRRFALNGSGRLEIDDYDQPDLELDVAGSGEVSVRGKTRRADLEIAGSGEADLDALTLTSARVSVAGSGDARLAPTAAAEVSIAGSGDVTLRRRPPSLTSSISGSGALNFED
jgi:hypothetical protein